MTLKIGTILIAKEDRFMDEEKANPWAIKENPYKIIKYRSNENDYMIIDEQGEEHYMGIDFINQHFTIKRYTLQDLKTRTDLMVRIENEEQAKKLKDAGIEFNYYDDEQYYGLTYRFEWLNKYEQQGRTLVPFDLIDFGNPKKYTLQDLKDKKIAVRLRNRDEYNKIYTALNYDYSSDFYEHEPYYGVDDTGFGLLYESELEGRILLDSIDEIDLGEGKEEVLTTPVKVRTVEFLENLVREYESEIARLKGENAELETAIRVTTKKLGDATSQDLTKRERMAWEYLLKSVGSIEGKTWSVKAETAFKVVDTFLAKSKEVKNDD